MNNIEQMATLSALRMARIHRGADGMDMLIQQADGDLQKTGLKRIQFETHPFVFELLEKACDMLSVSKREFMEGALMDAISNSENTFRRTFKDSRGYEFGEDDSPLESVEGE